MYLKCDEQLLELTNGQVGEKLERVLHTISGQLQPSKIWGQLLEPSTFLCDEELAQRFLVKLIENYWGKVNLVSYEPLQAAGIPVEMVNERIHNFFRQSQSQQQLFQTMIIHGQMSFEQLLEFIFQKVIPKSIHDTDLEKLYLHQVGDQYLIQPIYKEHQLFWETLYAKKLFSLFYQSPLAKIEQPLTLMMNLKIQLVKIVTNNRTASIIHKLTQHIDYENPRSFKLKQLHIFNIRTHFTSGRRHFMKLKKCIQQVEQSWGVGRWALNEKEKTLLSYMLLQEAVVTKEHTKIIEHGLFLVEGDRLNDHAVELVVEFSDVLSSLNPQPAALVKDYEKNYVESVFYRLTNALVKDQQFEEAYALLRNHELATSTPLFELFHIENVEERLHTLEATVQRDIAIIVDGSVQSVRDSHSVWQQHYLQRGHPYHVIALQTSHHVCNLLKILFVMEEDIIFGKLMSVYKKYLAIPAHVYDLRGFIEKSMEQKMTHS